MSDAYRKLTSPLRRRLKLLFSRAVGKLVDPSTLLQSLQLELLKGEVLDGVEHLEGYGRTAHPPAGYEALTASLGGDRAHTVAITACHRQFRVKDLLPGEQAIYDDQGQVIALLRDKLLYIYGCDTLNAEVGVEATITCPIVNIVAGTKVRIASPLLECTGEIKDKCDSGGVSMAGMRQVYNGHTHGENDTGGQTDPPSQGMV
jgi:phage baseplate assembly protein V